MLAQATQNHPTNARAPVVLAQQAQSFNAFSQFLDDVALMVGMTRVNIQAYRPQPSLLHLYSILLTYVQEWKYTVQASCDYSPSIM